MNLNDKTILLTGATGGIGEAIARQLAAAGARIILVGRSTNELRSLERELQNSDHKGFALQADIATPDGLETIRTALVALQIPVDVLINCAGVSLFGLLEDNEPAAIEKTINTNVTATILLTRQVLPFLHQDHGRILFIGSSFGALGFAGFAAYCASKFALRGFAEALRRELADTAIQVAHVAPRATNTRLNSPAVVALNDALGNAVDAPEFVAEAIEDLLARNTLRDINPFFHD
jgi:short-subunit dehydrogenase